MAIIPAIIIFGQEEGITIVKDGKLEVNTVFDPDSLRDGSPSLSKRELRKQRVAQRNLHYNILGGPSYTPDFGVLVGGSALMTFRMNPSDTTSQYRYSGVQVNPWFLFRLGESNFFAGPQIDINYDKITKPAKYLVDQPDYMAAGGTSHGYSNFSSGLGFLLTYDTRDVPANAYRGVYLDFRGVMYQKFFGSDNEFYRLEIDYRQYKTVGRRKVIAWTAQTKNVFGDVPLNKYALSGTPFDLRGYYMGQYRDKSSHVVMAEYRQMFNTDKTSWVKKMVSHLGFVAWGGCGFMGPNPGKIEGVLPNFGAGIRIEVQPRMNVRLDFGRNLVNKQNLFYFNMTEAF